VVPQSYLPAVKKDMAKAKLQVIVAVPDDDGPSERVCTTGSRSLIFADRIEQIAQHASKYGDENEMGIPKTKANRIRVHWFTQGFTFRCPNESVPFA
jgi:hypothetical protein